ncbi:C-type lectin domain family 4 member E-like isoform X2 [Salarias fasciatus]|uniref:C-type lectin domain family 4 member E-like isoform X2 n=1 Tax=Salarias fasciatus TaxID=181472 RepID=UPI001176C0E2|nr:C-type lectin domain family 4 member E-like isoform X2 [Salarias fasciatus]
MSQNEVVYSDVKFVRQNEKTNESVPSPTDATYSEVKIQKQSTESPGSHQEAPTSGGSKVTAERVVLLVIIALLIAAICGLTVTLFNNKKAQESLRIKWEAEKRNLTGILSNMKPYPTPTCMTATTAAENQACTRCEDGWEQNGGKCYYFSNEKLNWNKSRTWCENNTAHLVKIDSRDEQTFLEVTLRYKMDEDEDKFWIGLTDSEEEKIWRWADGSPLNESLIFWLGTEPDNWIDNGAQPEGEDCVRMGEKGGAADLKCWFDKSCKTPQKFICEKAGTDGASQTVCMARN